MSETESSETDEYKYLWDFFGDHIYCINPITHNDKYDSCKEVFEKYDIPVKYYKSENYNREKHGCFENHINIIKKAYKDGAERVLIFEDYISVSDHMSPSHLKKAINFMKKNEWDVFNLGPPNSNLKISQRTNYSGIYNLKSDCRHAYVVNRNAMKQFIYHMVVPSEDCYLLYPTLFYTESKNNIKNTWSSYDVSHITIFNRGSYMLIPLLIIIASWFICGMDQIYHNACMIALVTALLFFGIFTWK